MWRAVRSGKHSAFPMAGGLQLASPSAGGGWMFIFFTKRLGCAGSLLVSIVGTLLLIGLMRACSGGGVGMW